MRNSCSSAFLSTLSLRRATEISFASAWAMSDFYPRSPCGERHRICLMRIARNSNFYPRSPCGERPVDQGQAFLAGIFLSTLSLRRATALRLTIPTTGQISIHALLAESDIIAFQKAKSLHHFYPRSPCGERLLCRGACADADAFLSTLSLRRATYADETCGAIWDISIHALLAESDGSHR